MKSNIILLISWSIFFIISCNTSSNNIAEIHKSDSLIKEIKMDYIHSYDTSYHSQYANEPDSLFQLITHYKTNKTAEADFYKQLSESNQGKCFIQKMKEIYNYSKLSNQLKLPSGARIIEKKTISTKQKSDRMLILWIINPYVFLESENSYTCPEYATGKAYFEGKTFVSLISTPNHKIINTLQIENNFTTIDTIDNKIIHETSAAEIIPISARKRTRSNSAMSVKYFTINSTDSSDGKVQILHLEDFNQDGKPYEFALFENFGCAATSSTLYGYSLLQDKVIHYIIEKTYYANTWNDTIKVLNKDTTFTEKDYWLDAVFTFKPKPFPIKFAIDYRGRGGEYYYYFVDYNKNEESFKEIIDSRYKEGDENIPSSWIPMVH